MTASIIILSARIERFYISFRYVGWIGVFFRKEIVITKAFLEAPFSSTKVIFQLLPKHKVISNSIGNRLASLTEIQEHLKFIMSTVVKISWFKKSLKTGLKLHTDVN